MSGSRLLLLAMVAFLPSQAAAEELALEPVIAAALDHGTKVAHADIKLSQAEGQAQQAGGAFDWRVTGRAGWARLYYPRVQTIGGTAVLTNDLQSSWNTQITVGASRLFRDGIQVQPGITFYPNSGASQAQTFGQTRPVPSLNVQVPLMHVLDDGNAPAANERSSQDEVIGAQMERAAAQQQAAMEAAQTYWRCLASSEVEAVLTANRLAVLAYVDAQRKLMAAGQISLLALDQTLSAQIARDKQLDQAREEGLECRSALANLLRQESDLALPKLAAAFPKMDELSSVVAALRETALADAALRDRPDLHALEQYIAAARERMVAAQNERDPKINLLLDPNGFFVDFSYSLDGNAEDGHAAIASAQVADASLNLFELREQIRRNVSEGVAALRSSLVALADRNRLHETLAHVVEDARRAVQTGGMDQATLRGLEDQLADAAVQLIEARLDCALNLAALRLATGTVKVDSADAAAQDARLFLSAQF